VALDPGGFVALITVEQAEVGMVLVADVTDQRGRLLIPAGKDLSERHVNALPMWGVTHIEVEGDGPEGADETPETAEPWAIARAEEELEERFALANRSHPVVKELADICVRRRAIEVQMEGES
jgi:hypothetical protein